MTQDSDPGASPDSGADDCLDNAAMNEAFFGPYVPPDCDLLIRKKDLQKAKDQEVGPPLVQPYWPPLGWDSVEIPRNDSAKAIRQWFDFYLHPVGPLRCQEYLDRDMRRPVDCGDNVRDAWRLVRHLNAVGKSNVEVRERPVWYGAHEALIELESIYNQLFSSFASEETGAGSDQAESRQPQGNSILDEHLSKHPDATEDDALTAVNEALPMGAKPWTLDRLRKKPVWKEHKENRIRDYLTNNPDATVAQTAANVGYAESTVHGSDAWKAHMAAKGKTIPQVAPKAKEVPMTDNRAAVQEYRAAEAHQRGKKYTEEVDIFASPDQLREILLKRYEQGDSSEATKHRNKLKRLDPKACTELYNQLKEQLGMIDRPRDELIELAGASAEQWLDNRP